MVRQRYLESQINKIQEDYTKMMNESNNQHENLIEKYIKYNEVQRISSN